MQFSIGYFLSDLAMVLWYFPALGGLEYVSMEKGSFFPHNLNILDSFDIVCRGLCFTFPYIFFYDNVT